MTEFTKPSLTIVEHIALLKERGLVVPDESLAVTRLKHVGYYRLSGYALSFLDKTTDTFTAGKDFDMLWTAYVFDQKLRLLTMEAIERIEISIRAILSNTMCEQYGPHWFMDASQFESVFDHASFLTKLQNNMSDDRSLFIKHYFDTYTTPNFPPSWMVFEILTLGTVSHIFKNLTLDNRKIVAKTYGLDEKVLGSWLHALTVLRNICAHHARLYDRRISVKPFIAKIYKPVLEPRQDQYGGLVVVMVALLNRITRDHSWMRRLRDLLLAHPSISPETLGLPININNDPFWLLQ